MSVCQNLLNFFSKFVKFYRSLSNYLKKFTFFVKILNILYINFVIFAKIGKICFKKLVNLLQKLPLKIYCIYLKFVKFYQQLF